jgi:hypothetical protein
MSNQWKIPPSELYSITDPLAAYYFNRAVMYFGSAYEVDVEDAVEGARGREQARRAVDTVNSRWLADDGEEDTPQLEETPKYRDPMETFAEMKKRREAASGEL